MNKQTPTGLRIVTRSAAETERVGKELAKQLVGGEVLLLRGTLGAGKTTFLKGLAKGLGVRTAITSPTFVLMKVYETGRKSVRRFVHVDCYRIPGAELTAIGLTDYLEQPDAVTAIEWSERMKRKPRGALTITLRHGKNEHERHIELS